jgi:hypothetical protein
VERRLGDIERSVPAFEEAAARFGQAGDDEAAMRARGKAVLGQHPRRRRHRPTADRRDLGTLSALTVLRMSLPNTCWRSRTGTAENHAALDAAAQARCSRGVGIQRRPGHHSARARLSQLGDWQQESNVSCSAEARRRRFDDGEAFDAHLCCGNHLYGDRPYAVVETSVRGPRSPKRRGAACTGALLHPSAVLYLVVAGTRPGRARTQHRACSFR